MMSEMSYQSQEEHGCQQELVVQIIFRVLSPISNIDANVYPSIQKSDQYETSEAANRDSRQETAKEEST
jgi:hypothetical protein